MAFAQRYQGAGRSLLAIRLRKVRLGLAQRKSRSLGSSKYWIWDIGGKAPMFI